jgi:hypothetical protein
MLKQFRAIGAAGALLCGAVAAAQIPTSTEEIRWRQSDPNRSEVARTDAVFRDLVACVIRYQPARTRNLLETVPGTSAEASILYSFQSRMETCYDYNRTGGRALGWQGNLLRGVIAEVYYHRAYPQGVAPAANVPAETAAAWVAPRPSRDNSANGDMIHSTARCVMARRPAEVRTMLASVPLSAEERAAIRTIQGDLGACLDSGVEFTASRQALRGLLAEAAFHYGQAQRSGFSPAGGAPPARDEE